MKEKRGQRKERGGVGRRYRKKERGGGGTEILISTVYDTTDTCISTYQAKLYIQRVI